MLSYFDHSSNIIYIKNDYPIHLSSKELDLIIKSIEKVGKIISINILNGKMSIPYGIPKDHIYEFEILLPTRYMYSNFREEIENNSALVKLSQEIKMLINNPKNPIKQFSMYTKGAKYV